MTSDKGAELRNLSPAHTETRTIAALQSLRREALCGVDY